MPDAIITDGANRLLELGVAGVFLLVMIACVVYLERKATRREERIDEERKVRDKENLESRIRSVEATNGFISVTEKQNAKIDENTKVAEKQNARIDENTKALRDLTAQITALLVSRDR